MKPTLLDRLKPWEDRERHLQSEIDFLRGQLNSVISVLSEELSEMEGTLKRGMLIRPDYLRDLRTQLCKLKFP